MSDQVEVTKSESGKWWRMRYKGKLEFTEDEPSETQKKLFKEAVERAPRQPAFSGNGRGMTVSNAETKQVVEALK